MEDFFTLSDKEMVKLTEEQLKHYCDIELMKAGAIKPIQPIVPKEEKIDIHYTDYYSVELDYTKILFEKIEDADAFVKMNPRKADKLYDFPEPHNWVAKTPYNVSIERFRCVSQDDVQKYKHIFSKRKEEKKEYDRLLKEFNDASAASVEITQDVWSKYYDAVRKENKMKDIQRTWKEYLKLSENNEDIAMGFLKKAYKEDEIDDMIEWFKEEKI